MQDLLGGHIDFVIEPASNLKALLGTGNFKPFAITGKARLPSQIFSSFCRQRVARTSGGIGVSGKLVFQLVTPTSPT